MNIKELDRKAENPMFRLRKLVDRARYVMQDVLEDYFYIEEQDGMSLGRVLVYGFKRAGAKAEVVDDALHSMDEYLGELEKLFSQLDKELAAEKKGGAA